MERKIKIAVVGCNMIRKASLTAAIRAASELDGVEIVDGSDPSYRKALEENRDKYGRLEYKVTPRPRILKEDKNKDQFGTYKKRKWR